MKGTGIANTCPVIENGTTNLSSIPSGTYEVDKFCLEPTSFKVSSAFTSGARGPVAVAKPPSVCLKFPDLRNCDKLCVPEP